MLYDAICHSALYLSITLDGIDLADCGPRMGARELHQGDGFMLYGKAPGFARTLTAHMRHFRSLTAEQGIISWL